MKDVRISKKNNADEIDIPEVPNPRLLRAGVKQYSTFSDFRPVDTYNTTLINPDVIPQLPDSTHKKRTLNINKSTGEVTNKRTGARAVSFVLRSAFAALEEAHRKSPLSQLSSITVNFDQTQSDLIVSGNASKAGAAYYGNKLRDRFKRGMPKQKLFLHEETRFFLTIEDSKDGSLHANIVMRHHPDDVNTIRQMLKVEAKGDKNAVMLKTEYELWLDAEPGSELWQLNELELNDYPELCSYPLKKKNKQGFERFYRLISVDSGIADYISKELDKPLCDLSASQRLFIDGDTKSRAAELYEERFRSALQFKNEGFSLAIQGYELAISEPLADTEQTEQIAATKPAQNCSKAGVMSDLEIGMQRANDMQVKHHNESKELACEIGALLRSE